MMPLLDDGSSQTLDEQIRPHLRMIANNSWFNTGDLGYLDEDGYSYITGLSKEVINHGGESVSPIDVEEVGFPSGSCWDYPRRCSRSSAVALAPTSQVPW
jgi:hypothetical protein